MSTTPETLGVDPTALASMGNALLAAAGDIPTAPPPFHTAGTDAISLKIMSSLPSLELPIQTGLVEIKVEAEKTSGDIVFAASAYLQTDEELARKYEEQFSGSGAGSPSDGTGGAGSGSGAAMGQAATGTGSPTGTAGSASGSQGGSGMGDLGQLMGVAGQAVQLPMQAVGMLAAVPAGIMQGVSTVMQQVGQMAGGLAGDDAAKETEAERAEAARDAEPIDEERDEQLDGAAPGGPHPERAPVEPPATANDSRETTPSTPSERPPAQTRPAEIAQQMNL